MIPKLRKGDLNELYKEGRGHDTGSAHDRHNGRVWNGRNRIFS